jgi:sugar O-acyltransferase (sialic acid O-acetyltransferase NeuD family)
MKEFYIEQVNPNDTSLLVVEKLFKNGDHVNEGDLVFVVEGQKAAIDIEAECDGFFYSVFDEGDNVNIENIAYGISKNKGGSEVDEWINLNDVLAFEEDESNRADEVYLSKNDAIQDLTTLDSSKIKIAVLPGGKAFRQIEDALEGSNNFNLVGFFDDNKKNFPMCLGGLDFKKIANSIDNGDVDRVFVACGDSNLRATLLNQLQQYGIKTINVIHPTAEISKTAIIGSNVYIGPKVVVSSKAYIDNGVFISSLSNVEHHCIVGENTLFGPGVMLSGSVTIGKRVVLGAGVSVESNIKIGNNVYVSPGCGISRHLKKDDRILK